MAGGPPREDITRLLSDWTHGAPGASARLANAVERQLHRVAAGDMCRERQPHTLQPTALVNEAYLRLVRQRPDAWEGRAHFYGVAARVMRHVLVDHARVRAARKRAGARAPVSVSKLADPSNDRGIDILALNEALGDLARFDLRQAQIVALRYFGGLTEAEVAEMMDLSPATFAVRWRARGTGSDRK